MGKIKIRLDSSMPEQTPATLSYMCPKHKIEYSQQGYCSDCGKILVPVYIGATCNCSKRFIFKQSHCDNCGKPLKADNWAGWAMGSLPSDKGNKWESCGIVSQF